MDSTIRERIAMLCDEMLRRGVPASVVQHVIDWLEQQHDPHLPRPPRSP